MSLNETITSHESWCIQVETGNEDVNQKLDREIKIMKLSKDCEEIVSYIASYVEEKKRGNMKLWVCCLFSSQPHIW